MWLVLNRLPGRCLANNDICCIGTFSRAVPSRAMGGLLRGRKTAGILERRGHREESGQHTKFTGNMCLFSL